MFFGSRSWTKIIRSSQFTVVGWSPATVFFKTTVVGCSLYSTLCKTTVVGCSFYSTLCKTTLVGCSFYFTLCKTMVVGCLPPIISRKYHLRITPTATKVILFWHYAKKVITNYELWITNFVSKREQSRTCSNYAEREHLKSRRKNVLRSKRPVVRSKLRPAVRSKLRPSVRSKLRWIV